MKKLLILSLFAILLLSACSSLDGSQPNGPEVTVYKEPG